MTIHAGPKIITNGLVLCLDPGNTKSYIGSGTTVADLSGNGNNATLQASPTFNTANLGSFSLNGTTQYLSTSYTQPSVEAYSIEAWFRTATVGNQMTFAQCRGGGAGRSLTLGISPSGGQLGRLFFGLDSNGILIFTRSNALYNDNNWYQFTGVFSQAATTAITPASFTLYANGILLTNTATSTTGALNSPIAGSGNTSFGYHQTWNKYLDGTLAGIKIYNRALSANEIAQNFEAYRGRFGI